MKKSRVTVLHPKRYHGANAPEKGPGTTEVKTEPMEEAGYLEVAKKMRLPRVPRVIYQRHVFRCSLWFGHPADACNTVLLIAHGVP